jgi:hypothetical protein
VFTVWGFVGCAVLTRSVSTQGTKIQKSRSVSVCAILYATGGRVKCSVVREGCLNYVNRFLIQNSNRIIVIIIIVIIIIIIICSSSSGNS